MKQLQIESSRVFEYFKEICAIPHGSGNMDLISAYCMNFAAKNGLKAVCDRAKNVVIYKPGTEGYENAEPVILQGHLDMVCQNTEETQIDFEKDGIDVFTDGNFLKAKGTTLGADNGIAVSMILTVLESKDLSHPPIEAVFTTDEEIGMLGAQDLDTALLKGRKMINLDAEESDILTVSCAGGSDCKVVLSYDKKIVHGTKLTLEVKGLKGGHSGVEIDKGRINANILMGRLLHYAEKHSEFELIGINGGTKGNAIPFTSKAELLVQDPEGVIRCIQEYFTVVKKEISDREEHCEINLTPEAEDNFEVLDPSAKKRFLSILLTTPNGIVDMSAEIKGLVETSLNLGILMTEPDKIVMEYALRSNKKSALTFLEDKLSAFALYHDCRATLSGRYEPWEYKDNSSLQQLYINSYLEKFGRKPQVAAIHAGLECAVFSAKIDDLDCIAIGPDMFGVHTVNEKVSISSTREIFELLCTVLEKCK